MMRVSNKALADTVLANIRRNLKRIEKYHYQLSSGRLVRIPSDDPVATILAMRTKTYITITEQFKRNIENGTFYMQKTDTVLGDVCTILHRVRQLTVQGATDAVIQRDRDSMAEEIDAMIEEALKLANTQFNAKYIFGGTKTLSPPFVATRGGQQGASPDLGERKGILTGKIVDVKYVGNLSPMYREVEEEVQVSINVIGERIFAATVHEVIGAATVANPDTPLNASENFNGAICPGSVPEGTGVFAINGEKILYNAEEDSLKDIVARINRARVGVEAEIVEEDGRWKIKIVNVVPGRIWMQDINGGESNKGNLLSILGLVEEGKEPPNNIHPQAQEKIYDLFDVLIKIRNDLYLSDTEGLREDMRLLDKALDAVLIGRAKMGAKINRFDASYARVTDYNIYAKDVEAKILSADLAEVIMNLRLQEVVQRASLASGARLIQPTLMDFLR